MCRMDCYLAGSSDVPESQSVAVTTRLQVFVQIKQMRSNMLISSFKRCWKADFVAVSQSAPVSIL